MKALLWLTLLGVNISFVSAAGIDFPASCQAFSPDTRAANAHREFIEYVPAGTNLSLPYNDATCARPYQIVPVDVCRVALYVETSIRSGVTTEVWLPRNWTGRFLGTGNGGIDGCIKYEDLAYGAASGFAVVGSNNGHNGTTAASFYQNSDVLADFAWRATVIGKQVTQAFYGQSHTKSYYLGCSLGGRQGMNSAVEFPDDFDGIVAGSPALDFNNLVSWRASFFPITGSADSTNFINVSTWKNLIHSEVLAQCDTLDCIDDGIIEDPTLCHFRPEVLICTKEKINNCLSIEQVEIVQKVFSPMYGENGQLIFPSMQPGSELEAADKLYAGKPFSYSKVADDLNPQDIRTWPNDLSKYEERGGKIITFHGQQDGKITSFNTERFYNHLSTAMNMSSSELDHFFRFFRISGMSHCSSGPGAWAFGQGGSPAPTMTPFNRHENILAALVAWVELGVAPETITGTKYPPAEPSQAKPAHSTVSVDSLGEIKKQSTPEAKQRAGDEKTPKERHHANQKKHSDIDGGTGISQNQDQSVSIGYRGYPLFWFLPERFAAHAYRPTDILSFSESPPEIPSYKEPRLGTVPVGMVMNVPDHVDESAGIRARVAFDVAVLHVSLEPPFWTIASRTGRLLNSADYCLDPRFVTEKLSLIKIREMIQTHIIELTTYRHRFLLLLRSWRKERRLWEVRLALSQIRRGNDSIFQHPLTHEDLDHLCLWYREQQAAEDRGEIDPSSFGRVTGMVNPCAKEIQPNLQGGFVNDAIFTRFEKLKEAIRGVIARINTLQAHEDEQQRRQREQRAKRERGAHESGNDGTSLPGDALLVDFEFDTEDPFPSAPVIDPLPIDLEYRAAYYHWHVERYGVWATKGLFKRATYLDTFQLAPPNDLSFFDKPRAEWPRGHQGLLPEHVDYIDDFQVHPWGIPATRFTQALRHQPQYTADVIYSKKARMALKSIELYIQDWPLPCGVRGGLLEVIQELQ
ncbi:tannase and feruloyl esterase-domain-containing protein [Aspergillus caelatus]|uniref:Carboxylic ester hydrolase n=1 Tax=Aspergillus caelatus TaxID=61420 RepID=A0A5N7AK20_9EURO|nr:tannase and feruloyl esterase-domain-containing protein [Aspergillus caelatus]KAE8370201.1 tannase and feruloyl esterase-domain-containing protein [Aspergillus caelatus]